MAGTTHVLCHTCSLPNSHNHSFHKNPLPQNLILPLKPHILKPLVLKAGLSPENTPFHPGYTKSEDGYLYRESRRVDEIMELVRKQSIYPYHKLLEIFKLIKMHLKGYLPYLLLMLLRPKL